MRGLRKAVLTGIISVTMLAMSGCGAISQEQKEALELGTTALQEYNYEEAYHLFDQAKTDKTGKKAFLHNKEVYMGLGICAYRLGEYEDAIVQLKNAEGIAQETEGKEELDVEIYKYLADVNMKVRDYEQALKYFDLALEEEKDEPDVDVYFGKYFAYVAAGQSDEANSLLKQMESLPFSDMGDRAAIFEGMLYYYENKPELAEEKLLNATGDDVTRAYYYLGLLKEKDNLDSAIEYFKKCVDSSADKELADAYIELCKCYIEKENYEEALNYLKDAKTLYGTQELKKVDYYEVILLEKNGQFEEAYEACKEYINKYGEENEEEMVKELTFLETRMN
ncbi:MAG: tetratricopeptide repeat protein [Lachnospiraceae bacterium]|nr:tetratricopeptide repeat protein [Lachnospiraceae bacterium]